MEYTICSESMPYGGSNSFIKSRFLRSEISLYSLIQKCQPQVKILWKPWTHVQVKTKFLNHKT